MGIEVDARKRPTKYVRRKEPVKVAGAPAKKPKGIAQKPPKRKEEKISGLSPPRTRKLENLKRKQTAFGTSHQKESGSSKKPRIFADTGAESSSEERVEKVGENKLSPELPVATI